MSLDYIILFVAVVGFGIGVAMQKHAVATTVARLENKTSFSFVRSFSSPVWIAGSTLGFIGWITYFQAVSHMDISFVQPMINFSVVIALFISIFMLHEKLSRGEATGVLFILLGGLLLFKGGAVSEESGMHVSRLISFILVSFIACGALSLVLVKARTLVLKEVITAMLSGSLKGIAAVLVKTTTVLVVRQTHAYNIFSLSTWHEQLLNFPFWLMIATNAVGYGLMQFAFSFGRASVIVPVETMASFLLPVFAGIFVFSEDITLNRIAGMLVISAGILILLRTTRKVLAV